MILLSIRRTMKLRPWMLRNVCSGYPADQKWCESVAVSRVLSGRRLRGRLFDAWRVELRYPVAEWNVWQITEHLYQNLIARSELGQRKLEERNILANLLGWWGHGV
ncbi:unnamed protein product, partial [Leptidea sinapis]